MNSRTLPDPETAPDLFEGLLTRRVIAYLIDVALIGVIALALALVGIVMGFLTFGLAWLSMPLVLPVSVIGYYVLTLGLSHRTTIGMWLTGIALVPARPGAIDGWKILIHPVLFWISIWICWPVSLAVVLFTPRRQMLHDLVLGTLMVRRSHRGNTRMTFRPDSGQRA